MAATRILVLLLTALALGGPGPSLAAEDGAVGPEPMVLDRVVAVVDDRIILASDVALEQEISRREAPTAGGLVWLRSDPLESLIDAAVIRGLAGDVAIYQPSAAEVRARQLTLRESFEQPTDYAAFLLHFGLNEDRLAGVLYAREVVERYVQRNLLLGANSASVDPVALSARYDAWINQARERASIRHIAPWSPEPSAFPVPR